MGRLSVRATANEAAAALPGDDLVEADVTMDRAFTLEASPSIVWPWLVQIGKDRAGWYLPRVVERFVPPRRRAARRLDPRFASLDVGQSIADWGGRDATLTAVQISAPEALVFRSRRGRTSFSWALLLTDLGGGRTRVHSRVRLGPVRRRRLAEHGGGAFDAATISGLANGLRERLVEAGHPG
ncbi:MAG: hypothetical protein ACR2FE_09785 [Aeromicrobium sp.]